MQLLPDNEMEVGLFVRDQWTKCSMWLRRCFGITIAPDTMVCALHALRMCLQESELWRCLVPLVPVLPSYPPPPAPLTLGRLSLATRIVTQHSTPPHQTNAEWSDAV
jgi:hypothetical protein